MGLRHPATKGANVSTTAFGFFSSNGLSYRGTKLFSKNFFL